MAYVKSKKIVVVVCIIILLFSIYFIINSINSLFSSKVMNSDDRTALNIKKGIEAYVDQTKDYRLENINLSNGNKIISGETYWYELVLALSEPIYMDKSGEYIPIFEDVKDFYPQNPKFRGLKIDVYSQSGKAEVKPWKEEKGCVITIFN
ncbi:UNVERIFIED_CONTAM: hypothetical protein Cloal_1094 [Acetivibrio alkalicellulosi]